MEERSRVETAGRMKYVWAKSFPYDAEIEQWLPLWQHLDDTSEIAGLVWDQWLADSVKQPAVGVLGEANARLLVQWLAGVHDIGKATPAFAVQVNRLADRMNREAGLRCSGTVLTDRAQLRHELAGAAILDRWLAEKSGLDSLDRRQLTAVVAGHHGAFPATTAVIAASTLPHLMGDDRWMTVQDDLLDRCAERLGLDPSAEWLASRLPQAAMLLITGVVIMSDWIASDSDLFPLFHVDDVPAPAEPGDLSSRARRGWDQVGLGDRWRPPVSGLTSDLAFRDRFGWTPHAVQSAVVAAAERMEAPGLLMLEAPMGGGKTEAAFAAAEVLARRSGSSGVYVALPTQATSNAMFSRMLAWLQQLPSEAGETQTVNLAHGKAALNDEFRAVARVADASIHDDRERRAGGASSDRYLPVIGEWMRGRKRTTFSNFVVGTIDQVLFAALRARHVSLRQLGLAGKVVIIDEVHAADSFMSEYLERAIEWLAAAGAPIILMSATLPASQRIAYYRAYETGRCARLGLRGASENDVVDRLGGDIGYPSIVLTTGGAPEVVVVPVEAEQVEIAVRCLDDDTPSLVALLRERLRDGGCAVVIRNTVRRAQGTARELREALPDVDVIVAHASFLAADRARIDGELVGRFGPPDRSERPHRSIIVATQVVEQSLDIDFDLMVTDLAPVDLLLQRIGRLHRHRRDRPSPVHDPACYVAGVDWALDPPKPDGGARAIYGAWPLMAALAVLGDALAGEPVVLPRDIPVLVQAAYADDVALPELWREEGARALAKHRGQVATRRDRADGMRISAVGKPGRDLYDFSRASHGTINEDDPRSQGYVRDGNDSIEVVVVQSGGGVDRIPDWVDVSGDRDLPLRHHPVGWEQAKMLARCTLRLPFALTTPVTADRVIRELEREPFEGWQKSPFLSGQLALVLDDDRRATLAGYRLRYDLDLGLEVERDDA